MQPTNVPPRSQSGKNVPRSASNTALFVLKPPSGAGPLRGENKERRTNYHSKGYGKPVGRLNYLTREIVGERYRIRESQNLIKKRRKGTAEFYRMKGYNHGKHFCQHG